MARTVTDIKEANIELERLENLIKSVQNELKSIKERLTVLETTP